MAMKTFAAAACLVSASVFATPTNSASLREYTLSPGASSLAKHDISDNWSDLDRSFVARYRGRGGVVYRGGNVHRGVYTHNRGYVRGNVYRAGVVGNPGRGVLVRRPVLVGGVYRPYGAYWAAGGALAAGAAIGYLAASAATAYGTPPAPGYCWYYTDPSQTQGFWDVCPQ
jgi:hypothetical protein